MANRIASDRVQLRPRRCGYPCFFSSMKLKRFLTWTAIIVLLASILWGFIAYWTSTNDCSRKITALNNPMKAIVQCEYGSPDVLKLEDVEKPVPKGSS